MDRQIPLIVSQGTPFERGFQLGQAAGRRARDPGRTTCSTAWRARATKATVEKDVLTDTRHQLADPAFGEGLARALR